jgi:hypothetical protein
MPQLSSIIRTLERLRVLVLGFGYGSMAFSPHFYTLHSKFILLEIFYKERLQQI